MGKSNKRKSVREGTSGNPDYGSGFSGGVGTPGERGVGYAGWLALTSHKRAAIVVCEALYSNVYCQVLRRPGELGPSLLSWRVTPLEQDRWVRQVRRAAARGDARGGKRSEEETWWWVGEEGKWETWDAGKGWNEKKMGRIPGEKSWREENGSVMGEKRWREGERYTQSKEEEKQREGRRKE